MNGTYRGWLQLAGARLDWLGLALLASLLLGLGLRVWGINFGLPYTYAPDEPSYLLVTLQIIKTGDLNPHWWYYPSLMFYLNAIALYLFFLFGHLAGTFTTVANLAQPEIVTMGVGRLDLPSEFLVSRGLVALFSAAAIVLVYRIGRRLHARKWVASLAALLFAVSPTVIDHSHRFGPDLFALFFLLASFFFSIRIVDEPKRRDYVLAGIAAGLAIASKYNAGLILVPLIVAHFLRFGFAGYRHKELYIGLGATLLAFICVVPFSILDLGHFWEGVRFQAFSYSAEGHAGQEGDALRWYVSYFFTTEGMASVLAAMCGVYCLLGRSRKHLVLISFPLVYFLLVSQLLVRNARTIMLIIPFVDLLAAVFVANLYDWAIGMQRVPPRPDGSSLITTGRQVLTNHHIAIVLAAVCALLVLPPLQTAFAENLRLTQPDGRETARQWLEANLPGGTRVAEESYSPYLDTNRFTVQGLGAIVEHPPEWYVQNGFEYLVLSQGMYKRYFDEPERYSIEVAKYNQLFSRFPLVARFNDNAYEIRVYKTDVSLPAHRIAARFGDQGDLIELVGYDLGTTQWMPGEPLRVKLYWRALRPANEPLELDLRLLGPDHRTIGAARGDLFQGKDPSERWLEGISSSEWTIASPTETEPGLYYIEANVVQARFAYRAPIKSWADKTIDPLSLGPFKMSVPAPSAIELQSIRASNVRFGDQIALRGYNLRTNNMHAGDVLSLTLYWQSLGKPIRDYVVFVHLLDAGGQVRAQSDAQPRRGTYPTSLWEAGETIRDNYAITLPADLAPGAYRIELGLYELASLTRVGVLDANSQLLGDHWLLPDLIQSEQ